MSIVAIIPARMAASRYPGNPLESFLGLSMIEHVRRRVSLCKLLKDVIVATCDKDIFNEVENFGGKAIMTSDTHESCIDRVEEAISGIQADIIINVQGDMPLVNPDSLEELVKPLLKHKNVHYSDMMAPITELSEIHKENVVKVVASVSGNAVYYSRGAIPSNRKRFNTVDKYYKQLGINAFRKKSLIKFSRLKRTPLEIIESVDMLRLLENDMNVRMVITDFPNVGVDTKEDLEMACRLMRKDSIFSRYKNLNV